MIKVLVVDDSRFFRNRVQELIDSSPGLEVVGTATNGREAIEQAERLRPDAITMDIEMPVMNGISAVRRIMATRPVPILMFSSLTHEGARSTLEALDAGALDFLPKRFDEMLNNSDGMGNLLAQRIRAIVGQRRQLQPVAQRTRYSPAPRWETPGSVSAASKAATPLSSFSPPAQRPATADGSVSASGAVSDPQHETASSNRNQNSQPGDPRADSSTEPAPAVRPGQRHRASGKQYEALVIGTSTGGPVALQTILTRLPADFNLPVLLIQHMPATFTPAFAQRLDSLCQLRVKEAEDGERLRPGVAYLAPGGRQMMLEGRSGSSRLRIFDSKERVSYKPSVDITFASCANVLQERVLAQVLTGMGADGREGARLLRQRGATVWVQDEESSVVYGMPQAVRKAGLADAEFALDCLAEATLRETDQRPE